MKPIKKVPVTILSGQLGTGKSTLLKRILNHRTDYKFAIVMNEFASTADIEGKTIQLTTANEGTEVQEWLELDNGCLCCSAQDHGVRAIESLMERSGSFDYIIIETSGIADPSQIATLFWLDSALESVLYLDGIITAVDSLHLEKQLEEEAQDGTGTVTKQIVVADCLYISKVDLVDPRKLSRVKEQITLMNPNASIKDSSETIPSLLTHLLNLNAFSSFKTLPPLLSTPRATNHGIQSLEIRLPILDSVSGRFDEVLRKLLWEGILFKGDEVWEEARILRAKGLLKERSGKTYILQGVRELYEVQEVLKKEEEQEESVYRLVLIGKSLDDRLRDRFLAALES